MISFFFLNVTQEEGTEKFQGHGMVDMQSNSVGDLQKVLLSFRLCKTLYCSDIITSLKDDRFLSCRKLN